MVPQLYTIIHLSYCLLYFVAEYCALTPFPFFFNYDNGTMRLHNHTFIILSLILQWNVLSHSVLFEWCDHTLSCSYRAICYDLLWNIVLSRSRVTLTWSGCCVNVKDINHPRVLIAFLFCSCVCFCLFGPFNFILFNEFSRQLSVFPLCSSGLISALLVLSTIYLFMKVSLSPDILPSCCLGSKHQLTN